MEIEINIAVMFNDLGIYERVSNKAAFKIFDEHIAFKKEFRTEVDFAYHFIPIVY